ncbi:MAG: nuclear transport factor 2 family protein [Sandaracinus sp.]|nr:nuclear transport factor 2 family protein [Sandaracinus sp.]
MGGRRVSSKAVAPLEDEVRAVNEAFYRAFRERDLAAMERLWAEEAPIACIHPGLAPQLGRAEVMRGWRVLLAHPRAPTLVCSQVKVHVLGTAAYVTCLEGHETQPPRLVATNVFVLEEGRWRMVHHQAGPLAGGPPPPPSEPPPPDEDPYRFN